MIASGLLMFAFLQAAGQTPSNPAPKHDADVSKFMKKVEAAEAVERKSDRKRPVTGIEITVIPTGRSEVDAVKAVAKALKKIYRDRPGFVIAAIPELGCIMIRADAKTRDEVIGIIRGLSPLRSIDRTPDKSPSPK